MKRTEELEIIGEILENYEDQNHTWLFTRELNNLPDELKTDGYKYTDQKYFELEREKVFMRVPLVIGTANEVETDHFIRRQICGKDILITRDQEGSLRGFYNICKHRAAPLCQSHSGEAKTFRCPYHSWTYNNQGKRIGLPSKEAFPDEEVRLDRVQVFEFLGLLFVYLGEETFSRERIAEFLGERLVSELEDANIPGHKVLDTTRKKWNVNWKLAVEGGLENYHFRSVHSQSVGPQFDVKFSGLIRMDSHIRFITPRVTISKLKGKPDEKQSLRSHAFITYLLLPNLNIFLERNTIVLHLILPLGPDKTEMVNISLIPVKANLNGKAGEYYRAAHKHTDAVLVEDYDIHTGQQNSLNARPETVMTYGKQETGIIALHDWLERQMSQD